jgi:hypothetical protein
MLFLWHVIGENSVEVHQEKIRAIIEWPTPKNLTELKIFLSLSTYYRKFVNGFSQLMTPLTDLTKKGAFIWIDEAQIKFEKMKQVTSSCPVLALPDFTHPSVLECDASRIGIGVVLMKNNHPISFESLKLRDYEWNYSTYDKDMLAIIHALAKFRQYLVGNMFKVMTNHNSLRFLRLVKIKAYDFEIEYVKGKKNVVVDALSEYHPLSPSCIFHMIGNISYW